MKRFQAALMSASIFFMGSSYGAGVDVQVKASLDFVKLMYEVASWVKGAVSRHDEKEIKRLEESVPKLSGQLSNLAGEKKALAKYLTLYGQGSDKNKFEKGYKDKVEKLNIKLKELQQTLINLDPIWTGSNPTANFNASEAVAQKELFLQEYGMPEDFFALNMKELATAYYNEADNLLKASVEISNSLKASNSGASR